MLSSLPGGNRLRPAGCEPQAGSLLSSLWSFLCLAQFPHADAGLCSGQHPPLCLLVLSTPAVGPPWTASSFSTRVRWGGPRACRDCFCLMGITFVSVCSALRSVISRILSRLWLFQVGCLVPVTPSWLQAAVAPSAVDLEFLS